LVGLHVGSVRGAAARQVVRTQLARAASTFPRGVLSEERLRQISPNAAALRLPDSVFALAPSASRSQDEPQNGKLLLVVSAPLVPHLHHVRAMVDELVASGRIDHVSVAVQVTDVDSDRPAVQQLIASLDRDVDIVDEDLSAPDLIERYAHFDVVISSRLHAAVFGLLGGVPSFPIDVSDDAKAVDVFGEVGLGDFVLRPEQAAQWAAHVAELSDGDARTRVIRSVDRAYDRYSEVRLG
ncbi:MAG: polysaccharide pyruvyl transferase family protein, partial [Actinomycetota bacterium]|nr:polysaccharide pyruvyl transferase family protein [Actinomycetota bacterium]